MRPSLLIALHLCKSISRNCGMHQNVEEQSGTVIQSYKTIEIMKRISVALLIVATIVSLNSCRKVTGHGPLVNENRSISNFNSISFGIPGDLYYTEGSNYNIEIVAQENILKEIETTLIGTELKIRVRDHVHLRAHEDIRINITAPALTTLSSSGTGNVKVLQPYRPSNSKLAVSGSGTMTIQQLETNNIDAEVSGSGELFIASGTANHINADISGSGRIDMIGLTTNTANTKISGSGSVKVNVIQELTTKISGSGKVYYKGNPTINTTITGAGKVIKL